MGNQKKVLFGKCLDNHLPVNRPGSGSGSKRSVGGEGSLISQSSDPNNHTETLVITILLGQ